MSYQISTTPSQNVQPAKEQYYTREQLKEDLATRDSKKRPYSARPGATAWAFEKEQMNNQGLSTATKKRGIRGLFARDHAKGAEKEARKEMFHAEKAERYAQRSRDPALNDRQRRKFLRKAAKQQASADFHESLKKKHIIGATPGHKFQAVPAMATHHPIIHDNTNNTVRATVNDQSFAPSRLPIGPAAFDGIAEVGSRQAALEPHPAVLNAGNYIAPRQRWEGQVFAGKKLNANQPVYISTGDRQAIPVQQQNKQWLYSYDQDDSSDDDSENENIQHRRALPFTAVELKQGSMSLSGSNNWRDRKAPFTRAQLRQGAEKLQFANTQTKQGRWFNDNQLSNQGQKLRKVQTIEKGGLSSFSDEWERRRRWQANRSMPQQTNQSGWYQYNQLYSQQVRDQIQAGKFTEYYQPQQGFVMYASQPALQRQATALKKTETRQYQGSQLQQKDLKFQGQNLRKVQTVEKGGFKSYAEEFTKNRQQNRSFQQQTQQQQPIRQQIIQQQPIQQLSKEQQRAQALQANNNLVTVSVTQVTSQ